jgi:hypothetical protein
VAPIPIAPIAPITPFPIAPITQITLVVLVALVALITPIAASRVITGIIPIVVSTVMARNALINYGAPRELVPRLRSRGRQGMADGTWLPPR